MAIVLKKLDQLIEHKLNIERREHDDFKSWVEDSLNDLESRLIKKNNQLKT